MKETEIINDFNNLIASKVKENELKKNADFIRTNAFFIEEKATDSRLGFNITSDIDFIHSDLIYITGILFTFRPHINNPLLETVFLNGKKYSTYHQNMFDSIYINN